MSGGDTIPQSAIQNWGRDRALEQARDLATPNTVSGALASGRRATLEAIRDRLAAIMDGSEGHNPGCECECGTPWDAGKLAGIARELRAVVQELDDLPNEGGGSEIERINREREARREQARAEQDQGES